MTLPHQEKEMQEFASIKERFPESRIKKDYNREILDIGVEIPCQDHWFILLKGEQTGHMYELIAPDCKWFEGLEDLEAVDALIKRLCRETS